MTTIKIIKHNFNLKQHKLTGEKMKINYKKINNEYEIAKRQLHNAIEPKTQKKKDQTNHTLITPIIPINIAKQIVYNHDLLSTCVETQAQDIVLNNIKILTEENVELENHTVTDFWNSKTLYQLYLAVQDRISYGYGACEILKDSNGDWVGLEQISADTVTIEVKTDKYTELKSYYCRYDNGIRHDLFKLSRFDYDEEDNELGEVLWLGGGRESIFYDIPVWLPAFEKIQMDEILDELNTKKINEGNLLSGILTVVSPPYRAELNSETGELEKKDGEEEIKNSLREQMSDAGVGIMTLHLEQLSAEYNLNVQYIPITDQNYDYLRKLAEDCDNSILRLFKIPKVRLMIDDIKESMNSNKTDAIWQIYTKELKSWQTHYNGIIDDFNLKYFKIRTHTTLELPLFSDKKEIELTLAKDLFKNGLLTLNQTIKIIKQYYPELEIEEDKLNDGRYYYGKLLGMVNYDEEVGRNQNMEELYAFFDIQSDE